MAVRRIGEGAEAVIYRTTFLSRGAIVKRRMRKDYREPHIDVSLRRQRTRNEARAMAAARGAGVRSPGLLLVTEYDIVMEEIGGTILSGHIPASETGRNTIMREMGALAAALHNAGVSHGDFTSANIMISKGHANVIDFGLATLTPSTEDKAMDLILMKRSIGERDYALLEAAYKKHCADSAQVLARLKAIERRGRYKTRTLEVLKQG